MQTVLETNWMDYILQKRWLAHVLFWVLFVVIFTTFAALNTGNLLVELLKYVAMLPAYWLATYSLVYYIGPRFWTTKRYAIFSLLFILSAYVCCAIARWCIVHIAEPYFRNDFNQETILEILADPGYLVAVYFPLVYLIVFIFFAIKNVKDRLEERHQLELLKKEQVQSELRFLKTQIHPHFLFNTLNNLYSLTQEQSPKASEVVLKLSDILDHMLYRSNASEVPLQQELQLIQNYLDLEALRYGDKLSVSVTEQLQTVTWNIAPLILLSLVENAFKHGVRKGIRNSWVNITAQTDDQRLYFSVANSKSMEVRQDSREKEGIGSNNVKRQLDLLYADRHQLTIEEKADSYTVTLEITAHE